MTNNFLYSDGRLSAKLIALINFTLSLWLITFDPVLSKDAITYLLAAEAYIESGMTASLEAYSWPFFPVLFATIHQITFIPLHLAALLVVSIGFFLTSYAFVRIVAEMGGSPRAQLFGLIIITFHPLIAGYRSSIIRDSGLWAFMLLAMLELLRYSKNPTKLHQYKWLIYIGAALLLRIETIAIALLSPLSLLAVNKTSIKQRIKTTLHFYAPLVFSAISLGGIFLLIIENPGRQLKLFADIGYYTRYLSDLSTIISQKSIIVADTMISHTSKKDADYAVITVFFTICFINVIRAITPIYLATLLLGRLRSAKNYICSNADTIIKVHLLIIGTYLFLFTISRQFNIERYSFQLVIVILLYLPFIVDRIWQLQPRRPIQVAIILIFIGYFLDTIINSDYKKDYIHKAAIWLKNETPADTEIVSNHHHIAYFSEKQQNINLRRLSQNANHDKTWRKGVTYAFHAKESEIRPLQNRIAKHQPIILKEFKGGDQGSVIIFKLPETI